VSSPRIVHDRDPRVIKTIAARDRRPRSAPRGETRSLFLSRQEGVDIVHGDNLDRTNASVSAILGYCVSDLEKWNGRERGRSAEMSPRNS